MLEEAVASQGKQVWSISRDASFVEKCHASS